MLNNNELKKIIYTSPLKSLSNEKFEDWKKRFPDKTIIMLTGDTLYSGFEREKQMKACMKADIIICTSELLDSCTRRGINEKTLWLSYVGLLVTDESHVISTSRGSAIESGIMSFSKLNPKAKILFLSATMPNVSELGGWLTKLNKKETEVIYCDWRPVELQMHYEEYYVARYPSGHEDYWGSQENKRSKAVKIAMSKPDEKFLIFCHDKGTGRDIVKRLEQQGEQAFFHNADLKVKERLHMETKFQDKEDGLRILVSTSTLAYGRNLPARNVIIVGVNRGLNEVDELDIIQESGRAGRLGLDDIGHVFLVIPEGSTETWKYIFKNPRSINSVMNNHHTLAFHILAEIQNKEVWDTRSLLSWYERTLAHHQNIKPFNEEDAIGLISDLERMEMISGSDRSKLFITNLGKVSAWLYYSPYDVYDWYKNFKKIFDENIELDDLTLAWALTDIESNNMGYIPKDIAGECEDFRWRLKNRNITASDAIPNTVAAFSALTGKKEKQGLLIALSRNLIFDIDRIKQALSLIDTRHAKWDKEELWNIFPLGILSCHLSISFPFLPYDNDYNYDYNYHPLLLSSKSYHNIFHLFLFPYSQ